MVFSLTSQIKVFIFIFGFVWLFSSTSSKCSFILKVIIPMCILASVELFWLIWKTFYKLGLFCIHSASFLICSVADPDSPDPRVFGPPGSGSESISHYILSKIVRKTLISTVL